MQSFHDWLRSAEDAPEADRLAMLVAQAGAAGISLDRLRRLVQISPETLADLLKVLVAGGQVTMLKVGGKMVYRVVG